ncbi:hypothetical protein ACWCXB_34970 [Streptomyces sp. NPDC001514]
MRPRLLAAVRTLLDDRRIVGRKDVVRVGALVLLAKASFPTSRVRITARELARWLGVSESTIDHQVLSVLREVEAVAAQLMRGADGRPTGTEYRVEPLWEAQRDAGAPLALSKAELATLLRFLEGLFAPGWGERCATPPGLLAERRGRGAASDRLAVVLLALHARPDGRVPLVGGPLAKTTARHGRAAATLARMIGCRVPTAATVLGRLRAAGAVTGGAGRLRVPAVAAAHRVAPEGDGGAAHQAPAARAPMHGVEEPGCPRCAELDAVDGALPVAGEGWRQESRAGTDGAEPATEAAPGGPVDIYGSVSAGQDTFEACGPRRGGAESHTDHASVAEVGGEVGVDLGFSGEAASASCPQPVRACEDEKSPVPEAETDRPDVPAPDGDHDPLRGDDPRRTAGKREPVSPAAATSLLPKGLERVLEPVASVWGRLDRPATRRHVARAVRVRLDEITGLFGPDVDAERILRARVERRLAEQGSAPIRDAAAWLIGRGLPRRAVCPDVRCDDGCLMVTQERCGACRLLVLDGRALRARASATATTAGTGGGGDRSSFEAELNACWRQELTAAREHRAEAARERRAREAAVAERRALSAAQEAVRRALPCRVCGKPDAAGLCGRCRDEGGVEELVAQAVDVAVATWGISGEAERVEAARRAEDDMRGAVEQAVAELLPAGGAVLAETIALAARLAAELQFGALRRRAVDWLAACPEARAEYENVFAAEMRRGHRYASLDEAREAARQMAETARLGTARALLGDRLRTLRAARPKAVEVDAEPDPYTRAADQLRALIRPAPSERNLSVRRSHDSRRRSAGGGTAPTGTAASGFGPCAHRTVPAKAVA